MIGRLGDWDDPGPLSGHDSPAYAPNLLGLLADLGVRAGDDPRVDTVLRIAADHARAAAFLVVLQALHDAGVARGTAR